MALTAIISIRLFHSIFYRVISSHQPEKNEPIHDQEPVKNDFDYPVA